MSFDSVTPVVIDANVLSNSLSGARWIDGREYGAGAIALLGHGAVPAAAARASGAPAQSPNVPDRAVARVNRVTKPRAEPVLPSGPSSEQPARHPPLWLD